MPTFARTTGLRMSNHMEQVHLYVIGVDDVEDWQAGRGSIYYFEDRNSEKALPVFSTPGSMHISTCAPTSALRRPT